jgi:hypothetical protein
MPKEIINNKIMFFKIWNRRIFICSGHCQSILSMQSWNGESARKFCESLQFHRFIDAWIDGCMDVWMHGSLIYHDLDQEPWSPRQFNGASFGQSQTNPEKSSTRRKIKCSEPPLSTCRDIGPEIFQWFSHLPGVGTRTGFGVFNLNNRKNRHLWSDRLCHGYRRFLKSFKDMSQFWSVDLNFPRKRVPSWVFSLHSNHIFFDFTTSSSDDWKRFQWLASIKNYWTNRFHEIIIINKLFNESISPN